ncbi:hypothetical protein BHE74_00052807 [Ensete ventricosum]|nr:hypothetical protein BHE74_00052807 [Ensete ventricosum]
MYCPVRAVCTGPSADWYADCPPPAVPLIGAVPPCYHPKSISNGRFRPSAVDFGRYQPREGERRRGRRRGRRKPGVALHFTHAIRRPREISSPRAGRRNTMIKEEFTLETPVAGQLLYKIMKHGTGICLSS